MVLRISCAGRRRRVMVMVMVRTERAYSARTAGSVVCSVNYVNYVNYSRFNAGTLQALRS